MPKPLCTSRGRPRAKTHHSDQVPTTRTDHPAICWPGRQSAVGAHEDSLQAALPTPAKCQPAMHQSCKTSPDKANFEIQNPKRGGKKDWFRRHALPPPRARPEILSCRQERFSRTQMTAGFPGVVTLFLPYVTSACAYIYQHRRGQSCKHWHNNCYYPCSLVLLGIVV